MKINNLNPKYTFNNFIVGDCNSFAHAAAKAIVDNLGKTYNPLFIFGNDGLGKTHLMHAIGNEILKKYPNKRVLYLSSNEFIFDIIESIQKNEMIDKLYAEKYENIDVLLLDDIQFIAGKERVQEELFHIFNKMYQNEKQIILTSDREPKYIPNLRERLINRFEWGLFADLLMPDYKTKLKIIKEYIKKFEIDIDDQILSRVAKNDNFNIRELEGIINKLVAVSSLSNKSICLEELDEIINFYNN